MKPAFALFASLEVLEERRCIGGRGFDRDGFSDLGAAQIVAASIDQRFHRQLSGVGGIRGGQGSGRSLLLDPDQFLCDSFAGEKKVKPNVGGDGGSEQHYRDEPGGAMRSAEASREEARDGSRERPLR